MVVLSQGFTTSALLTQGPDVSLCRDCLGIVGYGRAAVASIHQMLVTSPSPCDIQICVQTLPDVLRVVL